MSKIDQNTILEVKNFSVIYEPPHTHSNSMRDKFVEAFKNPLDFFFKTKDIFLVLDNISFEVKKGEIIGLIGANGVGKTSLCRYLSGIISSENINCSGDVRAIFETNISLYPNLSGYENTIILTELLFAKFDKKERMEIVREALEFSDLKEFVHMPINRYSKGMKARLYLAIVTARPADLIILDEIFGATDMFFAEKLSLRIKNLIQTSGASVIVSHNMEDIKNFCNKLIILSEKKIKYNGNIEDGIKMYESLEG